MKYDPRLFSMEEGTDQSSTKILSIERAEFKLQKPVGFIG